MKCCHCRSNAALSCMTEPKFAPDVSDVTNLLFYGLDKTARRSIVMYERNEHKMGARNCQKRNDDKNRSPYRMVLIQASDAAAL